MHDPTNPSRPSQPSIRSLSLIALLSAALASISTLGLVTVFNGSPIVTVRPVASNASAVSAVSAQGSIDPVSVVAHAQESVVTITAQGIGGGAFSAFDIPATGVGSGIVVGDNGLILTNNHVVEGASSLTVTTASGQDLTAIVVETDAHNDMAIVRASGGDLSPATLGEFEPAPGWSDRPRDRQPVG